MDKLTGSGCIATATTVSVPEEQREDPGIPEEEIVRESDPRYEQRWGPGDGMRRGI